MMKVADLPEWYAPHLDDVYRICGPSASLYVWNTAEGWATLHPGIVARGWTFRTLIVWEKVGAHPARITAQKAGAWPDVTEVCGHYHRGTPWHQNPPQLANVWPLDSSNTMRHGERLWGDGASVWPGGVGRAYTSRTPLHPCQKPLQFAERMIRASTRPGESVWAPFGGTCREAVAAQRIDRQDPAEARRVVTAELDMDGRDYLGAVCRVLNGEGSRPVDKRQPTLFDGLP